MFCNLSRAKGLLRCSHVMHPGKGQCELRIDHVPVLVRLPIFMLLAHPANVSSDSMIGGNQFNLYSPLLFVLTDTLVFGAAGPICLLLYNVDRLHVFEAVFCMTESLANISILESHELGYSIRG